jgi:small-conductance mechanosensitive channel
MSIGVTYGCKIDVINNAVEEIREMLEKHPGIAT